MEVTVYKVVNAARGKKTSVWAGANLAILYTPGVRTEGKHGPILAFDSIEHAERFARLRGGECEVWRCATTNEYREIDVMIDARAVNHCSAYEIRQFWKGGSTGLRLGYPPPGTVACSDITLLEKVWPKETDDE